MSRVDVHGMIDQPIVVVAPVTQVAFNRRHPIARDIATYCKRRSQTAAPVAAMCSNDPARVDAIRRAFRPCPHGGRKIRGGT